MTNKEPERRREANEEPTLEVTVRGLALDAKQRPVVLLEGDQNRILPIWIGVFEATAIQIALDEVEVERPLTHDLLASFVDAVGATCEEICIAALRDNTYYAEILVRIDGELRRIDSRPSDALALAVRCGCPIQVDRTVFEESCLEAGTPDEAEEDAIRRKLDAMDAEDLGKYTM